MKSSKSRKPFRRKWRILELFVHHSRTIPIVIVFGAIALVQIPVAGVNVPYESTQKGPDPSDPDLSYSYVLNKDVRYRKPKYFSNVSPVSSSSYNSGRSSRFNDTLQSSHTSSSGNGRVGNSARSSTALVAASSPVPVATTSKLGLQDER